MTKEIVDRVTRIESKLTRFMLGMGFDHEGNPVEGTLVLSQSMVEDILDALWLATREVRTDQQAEVRATYNQLLSMKEGRWPSN